MLRGAIFSVCYARRRASAAAMLAALMPLPCAAFSRGASAS